MAYRSPEISGSTIVLLGSFNPKIFQPEWFARQKLITPQQSEAADVKIIIPQISHFETEQIVIQVTPDRFSAASKPNSNYVPLRDLVQGTFFILEHTPATAMGLNFQMHVPLESEEAWHTVGDKLAPKDGWQPLFEDRAGMAGLAITSKKKDPEGAAFTVRVEPSAKIKFGVYFDTNEHYPAPKDDGLKGLMKILVDRWEGAHSYATRVVDHILSWAAERK